MKLYPKLVLAKKVRRRSCAQSDKTSRLSWLLAIKIGEPERFKVDVIRFVGDNVYSSAYVLPYKGMGLGGNAHSSGRMVLSFDTNLCRSERVNNFGRYYFRVRD